MIILILMRNVDRETTKLLFPKIINGRKDDLRVGKP